MTSYDKNMATHQTLTANQVDTVTLASLHDTCEVYNAATSDVDIWIRTDGSDPTVAGDDCIRVPAGTSVQVGTPGDTTLVKLIASSGVPYSVTGLAS